jgi:hypothetical protein
MRQTIDRNLETLTWVIDNSKSVNPVQADKFEVYPWSGGMTTLIQGPQWSGALAHTPALRMVEGATLFTLDYRMLLPGTFLTRAQALEFDLMVSGPAGSVANGSCQCVVASNFMWQIASPLGWVDTGIKTPLRPDVWIPVSQKIRVDWTAKTRTFLYLTVAGLFHPVPEAVATLPLQDLAWEPNVVSVQRQLDLAVAGCYTADDTSIDLTQE